MNYEEFGLHDIFKFIKDKRSVNSCEDCGSPVYTHTLVIHLWNYDYYNLSKQSIECRNYVYNIIDHKLIYQGKLDV